MLEPTMDPNNIANFKKLDGIEVSTATPSDTFIKNVKLHANKGYTPLHKHPLFNQIKGANNPIALVGGGPSIKQELDKIREFQASGFPILACGSSHDYLVDQGIIPDYCAVCDPDPITGEYLKRHNEKTQYFVALSCDPCIFELLKDRTVYVWNCKSDEAAPFVAEEVKDHIDIIGGCTVGLRSISIVMCFGYTNIHFWGFDSCMGSGDAHHAYEFETKVEEVGVTYPIRFGDHANNVPEQDGKYYICSGYQLAQAVHFQQFLITYGAAFTPTFHGEGMLTDYMTYLKKKSEQIELTTKTQTVQAA